MELTRFPTEVLAEIFSLVGSSNAFIQLWKSGSPLLQVKLALAVEILDLKDRNVHSYSRYPKCISSLKKLRVLKLDRGTWPIMSSGPQLSSELRSLKLDRLETLHLVGEEFMSALELFKGTDTDADTVETLYERGKSTLWNLNTSFANLISLKIDNMDTKEPVPSNLFPGLPNTLTHLAFPSYIVHNAIDPFMSMLPRSLLHLEASLTIRASTLINPTLSGLNPWKNPPPGLHTISRLTFLETNTITSLESIPRSLTKCSGNFGYIDWTPSLIATLPPGIANLRFDLCMAASATPPNHPDAGLFLPSQLRSLTLRTTGALKTLGSLPSFFPSLPRTLTQLKCRPANVMLPWPVTATDFTTNDFWPPGLTDLRIKGFVLTPKDLKTIPTTLKLLHAAYDASSPIDFSKLPRGLSELAIVAATGTPKATPLELVNGLTSSLTSLSIEASESKLKSKLWDLLPSSLLALSVRSRSAFWRSDSSRNWPPNLTELCLEPCTSLAEFVSLPASMKHLRLFFSSTFEAQPG